MFPWQQHANSHRQFETALQDFSQGVAFDWRTLSEKIDEAAIWLKQNQVVIGVGVALEGKNSFALLCYYLAALQLNARVLLLNPEFSQEKKDKLLRHNQVSLLVKFEQNQPHFSLLKDGVVNTDFACTMTLTSGSSGFPKAVVHKVQAHLDNAQGVCELMQFQSIHSWLLSLPLYHVSGQGIVWRWLLQGAELQLPSEDFYASVLNATHVSLVPTQAQRLIDFLQKMPQSAVKLQRVLLGGAVIPVEITEKLTALGIQSYVGYGLTEMASTVCAKPANGEKGVGCPLHGREVDIRCEAVFLRGAGLALGYWKEGNIEPLTDKQGWFESKDRGMWQDNQLHILGRLDNMFISGGENIQPEEIEQLMLQFPLLEQVVVLPVDDPEFGQRPVAMVKFSGEASVNVLEKSKVEELRLFLRNKIEKFKQPIEYFPLQTEYLGQIKISRTELKKQLDIRLGKN
ncbi:MAG: o-succinylbenzoate--CoA ligase [Lonepinella koalarum]|nr:o-succinylbenzoate--CoA ligase [Lonepinella koalarum]